MNETVTRFLLMLALFAFVTLVAQFAISSVADQRSKSRAVNKRLRLIEKGVDHDTVTLMLRKDIPQGWAWAPPWVSDLAKSFRLTLNAANIQRSEAQVLAIMGAAAAGIALLILIIAPTFTIGVLLIAILVGLIIGVMLPWMVISRMADKRRRRMESQFPVALDVFVRGLRSGHPIPAALNLLVEEMEDPIGTEFGIVSDEVAFGFSLREALERLAARWDLQDIHMFVVSVSVQMETGGNLAEILENLSKVIRERASMYMKVRALSSEGRMTGLILTALPILAFAGLFTFKPDFFLDVANDPIFIFGFSGLALLYIVGFVSIRRMVDLKV